MFGTLIELQKKLKYKREYFMFVCIIVSSGDFLFPGNNLICCVQDFTYM